MYTYYDPPLCLGVGVTVGLLTTRVGVGNGVDVGKGLGVEVGAGAEVGAIDCPVLCIGVLVGLISGVDVSPKVGNSVAITPVFSGFGVDASGTVLIGSFSGSELTIENITPPAPTATTRNIPPMNNGIDNFTDFFFIQIFLYSIILGKITHKQDSSIIPY
ncbi:MAG: hypothetical protein WCJ19_01330 [bacterium]